MYNHDDNFLKNNQYNEIYVWENYVQGKFYTKESSKEKFCTRNLCKGKICTMKFSIGKLCTEKCVQGNICTGKLCTRKNMYRGIFQ